MRRTMALALIVCSLAVSTLGGDIPYGVVNPPPCTENCGAPPPLFDEGDMALILIDLVFTK